MRVADLIDFDCGEWKVEMVRGTFNAQDCALILSTPLSKRWPKDEMYWRQSKEGNYNVKSGYWFVKMGHENEVVVNEAMIEEEVWKIIWGIDGPPNPDISYGRLAKGA